MFYLFSITTYLIFVFILCSISLKLHKKANELLESLRLNEESTGSASTYIKIKFAEAWLASVLFHACAWVCSYLVLDYILSTLS